MGAASIPFVIQGSAPALSWGHIWGGVTSGWGAVFGHPGGKGLLAAFSCGWNLRTGLQSSGNVTIAGNVTVAPHCSLGSAGRWVQDLGDAGAPGVIECIMSLEHPRKQWGAVIGDKETRGLVVPELQLKHPDFGYCEGEKVSQRRGHLVRSC